MRELCIKNLNFKNIIKYPDICFYDTLTCICGESGCGKSSLLKMLNGIVKAEEGDIYYNHQNIDELDKIVYRRKVLLVSQNVLLFEGSIKDNFNKFYELRELEELDDIKIKRFLEICKLNFDVNQETKYLSGGEKQRLFLSICLSFNPEILLLDEPTSALDEKNSDELIKNLKEYAKKQDMQIIMISHNLSLAKKYADKLINLSRGDNYEK